VTNVSKAVAASFEAASPSPSRAADGDVGARTRPGGGRGHLRAGTRRAL